MSYYEQLDNVTCIQIKEKASMIEAASAIIGQEIEMANKYKINDKETGDQILYAVEKTDCCTRQLKMLCGDCAAWNVDILYTGMGNMSPAIKMERPWTATFLCFNRPTVNITDVNSGEVLGMVKDPCTFCNLKFVATDESETPIVQASGGCCQLGLLCPLPCGPCSEVTFSLENPESGEPIGELKKKVPGILKFCLAPDVDNYTVTFSNPEAWTGKKKALMVALAIFMDFRMFSENPNDDNGGLLGQMQGGGE